MEGKGKGKAETQSLPASTKKSASAKPQKAATQVYSKLGHKRKSMDKDSPNGGRDKTVLGKKRPAEAGPAGSTRDGGGGSGGEKKGQVKLKSGSPWSVAWKGRERSEAVLDGLQRLFRRAESEDGSAGQREKLVEGLLLVARVTAEPVRDQALKYVDAAADRWKQSCLTRAWKAGNEATPAEILHALPRLYHMERVGVHHDLKPQVQMHMHTSAFSAKDYLGWDPVSEAPPDNILHSHKAPTRLLSRYEVLSVSVRHAFFAARLGLSLGGCGFLDVLRWVPKMRPYRGPGELEADVYRAQCKLIVSVVQALSDLGELRLPGSLMPHEFLFVREHLGGLLRRRELALAAQFLEVLHVFGSDGGDEVCEGGMAYLLTTMAPSGSWAQALTALGEDWAGDKHAADLHAIKALLVHSPRGYGPGIPDLVPQLLAWQAADADPEMADLSDLPPEPTNMLDVPMLPNGEYDLRLRHMEQLVRKMEAHDKKKAAKAARAQEQSQAEEGPVRERVLKIGRDLETAKEAENWRDVFEGLKALRKDKAIDKGVLEDTKIGKVVNKLRKATNTQVAAMAQKVVNQWKQMLETIAKPTAAPSAGAPS